MKPNFRSRLQRPVTAALIAGTVLAGALGAVSAAPAQAAGSCVSYQYSSGGYSTCIGYIQTILRQYNRVTAVDNAFGPATKQAVQQFQSNNGLTADGIVGAATWSKLCVYGKNARGGEPAYYATQARSAASSAGC